jgi:hypothetical protein
MRKEYDFSKAERGKFYRPLKDLEIPVYLDEKVKEFYIRKAMDNNVDLDKVVNGVLRKEMEIIKQLS